MTANPVSRRALVKIAPVAIVAAGIPAIVAEPPPQEDPELLALEGELAGAVNGVRSATGDFEIRVAYCELEHVCGKITRLRAKTDRGLAIKARAVTVLHEVWPRHDSTSSIFWAAKSLAESVLAVTGAAV